MATSWKDLLSTFDTKVKTPAEHRIEHAIPKPNGDDVPCGGIIFTDTSALSSKFGLNRDEIRRRIQDFIRQSERIGRHWVLLDASETDTSISKQPDKSWYSYHKILHSFIKERHISGLSTSVFIIGGDDVIAVPEKVFNLPQSPEEFLLQVDLWYCFPIGFDLVEELNSMIEEQDEYDSELFAETLLSNAVCNVSRLPLDNGFNCGKFEDTVECYFDRVLNVKGYIHTESALMTTASQWLNESSFMAEGIPMLLCHENPSYSYNGMYVAPYLSLQNKEGLADYCQSLGEADYLLFNMHGSEMPNVTGYLGIDTNCEPYVAFDIPLLKFCKSKVLTATACYGARYKGYGMNSSLLLSAIYQNFLLFTGSSNVALGAISENFPCGCSETLLKIYTEQLLYGVPAGEALLRSKIEYFTNFYPLEQDYSYFTICEFNVFGDPTLECSCHNNLLLTKSINSSINKPSYPQSYSKRLLSLNDVFERVRDLVDSNIEEIENRLKHLLFENYSFVNLSLDSAGKKINHNEVKGYVFVYSYAKTGKVYAHTDLQGKLNIAFYTK